MARNHKSNIESILDDLEIERILDSIPTLTLQPVGVVKHHSTEILLQFA